MNVTVHAAETSTEKLLDAHLPKLLRAAGDVSADWAALAVEAASRSGRVEPDARPPADRSHVRDHDIVPAADPADLAGGQLCPAGLADRPGQARRPLPAAGAGEGAVAGRPGVPRAGAGRRHGAGDPRPGGGGARHHHRRRDAAGVVQQPLRHRARGRRHRQPRHRARPQRAPQPGAADRRPDRAAATRSASATWSS